MAFSDVKLSTVLKKKLWNEAVDHKMDLGYCTQSNFEIRYDVVAYYFHSARTTLEVVMDTWMPSAARSWVIGSLFKCLKPLPEVNA